MDILIASKNDGKIKEIKDFFKSFGSVSLLQRIRLITYKEIKDFPLIEEGADDFLANAMLKARVVSEITCKITLADDSGLSVDLLGGIPGVISSRYAGEAATDKQNRDKLIAELSGFENPDMRTARFVCQMVLWDPKKGLLNVSEGICEGRIGFEEKGSGGFGYDPIFIPEGLNLTMAELSPEDKNRISHRGRALAKLLNYLDSVNKNT
ncbi:MAG: Non-canonical purine NTP pyrophosphatase [Actinobacteria bacterium ADurb.Bin346]|nr:MAG: Non-canonical purine NTP pyrophosphatase [Actinobacteria bacterium ADurb.Bin346]